MTACVSTQNTEEFFPDFGSIYSLETRQVPIYAEHHLFYLPHQS